jgi:hypothetical protein
MYVHASQKETHVYCICPHDKMLLGVKDMRWNVMMDSRGLEAKGILQSAC